MRVALCNERYQNATNCCIAAADPSRPFSHESSPDGARGRIGDWTSSTGDDCRIATDSKLRAGFEWP